jgi:hypothetical protein
MHHTMTVCRERRNISQAFVISVPDGSGEPQASTVLSLRELPIPIGYETESAPKAVYVMAWRKIPAPAGNYTLAFGQC